MNHSEMRSIKFCHQFPCSRTRLKKKQTVIFLMGLSDSMHHSAADVHGAVDEVSCLTNSLPCQTLHLTISYCSVNVFHVVLMKLQSNVSSLK